MLRLTKDIKTLKAFGNSMLPILQNEDVVVLKKKKFLSLKVNDIICFRKNQTYTTHRVIYIGKNNVITKGDSMMFSDGKIYPKNYVGTVTRIKRDSMYFNIKALYLIQSTIYFDEIVKLEKKLVKHKLRHVFLKSLPLNIYYEGSIPRRIYSDCDILLEIKNAQKTAKILKELGYKRFGVGEKDKVNN